jgi:hypothetical protein
MVRGFYCCSGKSGNYDGKKYYFLPNKKAPFMKGGGRRSLTGGCVFRDAEGGIPYTKKYRALPVLFWKFTPPKSRFLLLGVPQKGVAGEA